MANICKINDIEHEYEFKFMNSDGQEINYTSSAVRGLTIIENIFQPFLTGSVSLANPFDIFEDEYLIRGDGRDRFSVFLKPVDGEDILEETYTLTEETSFSNPETKAENIKKFSMIHENALPFMDTIPYGITFSGKSGEILKEIFEKILGEEFIDGDNWEDGDFDITFRPPLTYRYIDVVNSLLKYYYYLDGEIYVKGFIIYDRINKKYQLRPISKMFEDNLENTMEAFSVADLVDSGETSNPNNPPPDDEVEISEHNSGLKNFAYSTPMYAWNNDYFINSIVYGYDQIMGTHKMRIMKLEDFQSKWEDKFVKVFSSLGGEAKPFVVKNKTTDKKFRHYRTDKPLEQAVKMVEAEIYNTLTFYNLVSIFSNLGSLNREVGKFVDIFKVGSKIFKSDEKTLGRWFVTELRHVFLGDGYTNEFKCCKTYTGPQTNINQDAE